MPDDTQPPQPAADNLPPYVPIPPDEADHDQEPEAGDTHPVFGSGVQPQEIHDEKIVGSNPAEAALPPEAGPGSFDPENDPRTQQNSPETVD